MSARSTNRATISPPNCSERIIAVHTGSRGNMRVFYNVCLTETGSSFEACGSRKLFTLPLPRVDLWP